MSTTEPRRKPTSPKYEVGDRVMVTIGIEKHEGTIIEDRGNIGVGEGNFLQ